MLWNPKNDSVYSKVSNFLSQRLLFSSLQISTKCVHTQISMKNVFNFGGIYIYLFLQHGFLLRSSFKTQTNHLNFSQSAPIRNLCILLVLCMLLGAISRAFYLQKQCICQQQPQHSLLLPFKLNGTSCCAWFRVGSSYYTLVFENWRDLQQVIV